MWRRHRSQSPGLPAVIARMSTNVRVPGTPEEGPQATGVLRSLHADAWSAVVPYLPAVLLDTVLSSPGRPPTWINSLEGTLALADISGFTRLSERLAEVGKEGAEWLTNIIDGYFHRMLDIAREHGGSNVKFGGDALLLLFTGEDHPGRAVAAAVAMSRTNRQLATVRVGRDRIRLNMSVGVHSGTFWSASAGLPGRRMQHFILGREVSRVAQTEAAAAAGEVFVSEATLGMAPGLRVEKRRDDAYRVLRAPRHTGVSSPMPREAKPLPSMIGDLLAYLPTPVVRALQSGDKAGGIEGEHRKVTVMFIHLLGVDELLEGQGPGGCVDELQRYLSAVLTLADRHGGFLAGNDIYTEDLKLILLFGAPVAHEQDSANALRLALELDRDLEQLNLRLRHRIGINSGFVFAGDVGSPYRREYTVLGDAVNLAARLMSAASPGQILLSSQVADEAGAGFDVRELAPIRVKGKQAPIAIGSLEGERTIVPGRARNETGILIGREAEVDSLRRLCLEVEGGVGRCVVISGEAGMGKSRLAMDFQDYLSARGWNVHRGYCYSHSATTPFAPWVYVLSSFFGISPSDDTEERSTKVLTTLTRLRPDLGDAASLLNGVLTLSIPQSDIVRSLDDGARRRRLFELVTELLKAADRDAPLAIVLEDLHWADPSSLELANYVSAGLGSCRALLCLTHRPKDDLGLSMPADATVSIALNELSEEAAAQLIRTVLDRPDLPAQVAQAIHAKARGNPLFLEEVSRALRESSALDELLKATSFRQTEELEALEISDRIQGLIMSRIDALDIGSREVLRAAAVIGSTFDLPTLESALGGENRDADLGARLQALIDDDLMNQEEGLGGESAFRFKHALIQEVAYESLLFARRRELHQRVASYIEEAFGAQLEPFFGALVHHYGHSGDGAKTLVYAVKAGDKARQVFANEEAIQYYRRALSVAEEESTVDPVMVVRADVSLGDVQELIGNHDEAIHHYACALEGSIGRRRRRARRLRPGRRVGPQKLLTGAGTEAAGTRRGVSDICRKIGYVYDRRSDYSLALEWLQQGLKLLPPRSTQERARACVAISGLLFRAGRYSEAQIWCQRGLRHARLSRDGIELAHAHNLLGVILRDKGWVRRAVAHRLDALGMYEQLGNLTGQADTLNNLGLDYVSLGQWPGAVERFQECLSIASRIGDLDLMAIVHNNLGEVFLAQGELVRAKAEFRWTIDAGTRLGHVAVGALAEANLGEALAREGRLDEARRALEGSLRTFRRVSAHAFEAEVQARLAEVLFIDGSEEESGRLAQDALDAARRVNSQPVEAESLRVLGRLKAAAGEWDAAQAELEAASQHFRRAGARHQEARTLTAMGDLFAAKYRKLGSRRDRRRALNSLNRAVSIFRSLGAKTDLEEGESALEALAAESA